MSWFARREKLKLHQFRNRTVIEGLFTVIATDKGNLRTNNEDAALISYASGNLSKNKGCLLALADGMGGHNGGEVASELALSSFTNAYFNHRGTTQQSLQLALKKSNQEVFYKSLSDPEWAGMGTTLTAVAIIGSDLYMAHVGDSRAYLINSDNCLRLSKDQTLVQQLVDLGQISAAQAESRPDRNVLLSALGTKAVVTGEVRQLKNNWTDEDTLLICSDGLYDLVNDHEIFKIVHSYTDIEIAAHVLINEAKKRGGHDNITVLLATRRQQEIPDLKDTRDLEIPLSIEKK